MEIGITGGEEDGVDNTGMDQNKLYTQPEQVQQYYGTSTENIAGLAVPCFYLLGKGSTTTLLIFLATVLGEPGHA